LLKEIHYLEDCYGEQAQFHYLMTKDRREIDFYVTRNEEPFLMAEVKWADSVPTGNFSIFGKYFPGFSKEHDPYYRWR